MHGGIARTVIAFLLQWSASDATRTFRCTAGLHEPSSHFFDNNYGSGEAVILSSLNSSLPTESANVEDNEIFHFDFSKKISKQKFFLDARSIELVGKNHHRWPLVKIEKMDGKNHHRWPLIKMKEEDYPTKPEIQFILKIWVRIDGLLSFAPSSHPRRSYSTGERSQTRPGTQLAHWRKVTGGISLYLKKRKHVFLECSRCKTCLITSFEPTYLPGTYSNPIRHWAKVEVRGWVQRERENHIDINVARPVLDFRRPVLFFWLIAASGSRFI